MDAGVLGAPVTSGCSPRFGPPPGCERVQFGCTAVLAFQFGLWAARMSGRWSCGLRPVRRWQHRCQGDPNGRPLGLRRLDASAVPPLRSLAIAIRRHRPSLRSRMASASRETDARTPAAESGPAADVVRFARNRAPGKNALRRFQCCDRCIAHRECARCTPSAPAAHWLRSGPNQSWFCRIAVVYLVLLRHRAQRRCLDSAR